MSRRSLQSKWERLLAREGLPAELPQARPRPTVDRDWSSHFGGGDPRENARRDAKDRLRLDAQTAADLFSMLADIRWGRHDETIEPLIFSERLVFDRYCDGQSFEQIAQFMGVSRREVQTRFYTTLARFTHIRPRLRRNHD